MTGRAPPPGDGSASNLHATTVVVREQGILIRGPSGAGKSRLGLALVAEAVRAGWFARIVADDRTLVATVGGRLAARPHPAVAGLVERRGMGIGATHHEPACVLHLVVDLVADPPPRLPQDDACRAAIGLVSLPRLPIALAEPTADRVALILPMLAACRASASLTTSS